jgi:hypothetical protein
MATTEQSSVITRRRQGLRTLSPDQLGNAINETEKQVNSIMLAFIGAAAFCILSLLTPDTALLGGSDKVNVPLAGPVSFVGFIIIGPAVLVVLRTYLEIYIEHGKRLARVARRVPAKRDPTLLSSQNAFLTIAFALVLSLLLPLTLFMFAWKAAVFPVRGSGLLCVAIAATVMYLMPRRGGSWRSRALLSVNVALLAGFMLGFGAMFDLGPPRRHFDLFRANLSGQRLASDDFSGANLSGANLQGADLSNASLNRANLNDADLSNASLDYTDLRGADLRGVKLSQAGMLGAFLSGAKLTLADLNNAWLEDADLSDTDLIQAQLDRACGKGAKLPSGLTLKPCPNPAAPARP